LSWPRAVPDGAAGRYHQSHRLARQHRRQPHGHCGPYQRGRDRQYFRGRLHSGGGHLRQRTAQRRHQRRQRPSRSMRAASGSTTAAWAATRSTGGAYINGAASACRRCRVPTPHPTASFTTPPVRSSSASGSLLDVSSGARILQNGTLAQKDSILSGRAAASHWRPSARFLGPVRYRRRCPPAADETCPPPANWCSTATLRGYGFSGGGT